MERAALLQCTNSIHNKEGLTQVDIFDIVSAQKSNLKLYLDYCAEARKDFADLDGDFSQGARSCMILRDLSKKGPTYWRHDSFPPNLQFPCKKNLQTPIVEDYPSSE